MLKPFTIEGQVESGVHQIIAPRKGTVAYTAVLLQEPWGEAQYGLGLAEQNQPGYWPIPAYLCHATTYDEVSDHAEKLNREMALSESEALRIVASSMRVIPR